MPKLKNRPPSYRFHKVSGQAAVTIGGRDHYLGQHGMPESHARYRQIVAQEAATSAEATTEKCHLEAPSDDLRLHELSVGCLEFAERYYIKNGRPTGEAANWKDAIRPAAVRLSCRLDPLLRSSPPATTTPRPRRIAPRIARAIRTFVSSA